MHETSPTGKVNDFLKDVEMRTALYSLSSLQRAYAATKTGKRTLFSRDLEISKVQNFLFGILTIYMNPKGFKMKN